MYEETTEKLLEFISSSPTAFHAAETIRKRFLEEGFTELKEEEHWELEKGGKYFVMRNHSAIIGFSIPLNNSGRYHIIASHSDSPSFKIKENPEMSVGGAYVKLNVERYGGMILSTWFDRPLSVAGRMIVRKNGKILEKLINIDRDLVMIPSLAIHMNRDINGGYHYNVQKDMLPLYSGNGEKGKFLDMIAAEAEVPYQTFVNRSDIAGGSTLGNISNTQAAMNTVDIGLPQLAMHSAYETAGVKDTESLFRAARVFYR